jgi:hypothetical protein
MLQQFSGLYRMRSDSGLLPLLTTSALRST